ncbi:MAG TPA: hypothetical protein VF733_00625 [Candidatus Saccharimonadales bacterium]
MNKLINKLVAAYPQFTFVKGTQAHWSPQDKKVVYERSNAEEATWTLLHELGHALLDHQSYQSDAHLLQKEIGAWQQARALAFENDIRIDEGYIEDCLDTYKDWIYKRSTCPTCSMHGLQQRVDRYNCLNCKTTWKVSSARFCRPYRLTQT